MQSQSKPQQDFFSFLSFPFLFWIDQFSNLCGNAEARNSKHNLGEKVVRLILPYIKACYKVIVIKTMNAKPD